MTLLEKTAEVLYLTQTASANDPTTWDAAPADVRHEYEVLAAAALTVAYREPVLL